MSNQFSAAQIAELRQLIDDISERLDTFETKMQKTNRTNREWLTLLTASMALTRRLTGNENLDNAIFKMQRAILIANQLRMAMLAAHAASGPVGWALVGISVIATGLTAAETMGIEIDRRGSEW